MPKTYEIRLREVRENYTQNSEPVKVRIPKFLHKEWQRRKKARTISPLSQIISHALHFAMFGGHPYADGLDGLLAAFEEFHRRDLSADQRLIEDMNRLLELRGIPVRVPPIEPTS